SAIGLPRKDQVDTGVAHAEPTELEPVHESGQDRPDREPPTASVGNETEERLQHAGDGTCRPRLRMARHRTVDRNPESLSRKTRECFREPAVWKIRPAAKKRS